MSPASGDYEVTYTVAKANGNGPASASGADPLQGPTDALQPPIPWTAPGGLAPDGGGVSTLPAVR